MQKLSMARKCSHCGHNGHNSRTCISSRDLVDCEGFKLFGVQVQMVSPMKKSLSLECISYAFHHASSSSSSSPTTSTSSLIAIEEAAEKISSGYLSDGLVGRAQERKKGVPWTEEEHRQFLSGLEKLGKGDWRGISRNFVTTRTPTQVASHAQKYFLRQNSLNKKKRRSSLFDVVTKCEGTNRVIEPSNSEGNCFAREFDAPIMTFKSTEHGITTDHISEIDLNCSSQSYLSVEMPHVQLSTLNLELSISSTMHADHKNASPSVVFLETIKVT